MSMSAFYQYAEQPFGSFTQIVVTHYRGAKLSVIPQFGANINELVLVANGLTASVIDGDTDAASLQANQWYKSAKLLPFANRINDGHYIFEVQAYQLPINFPQQRHAIHGLVYNQPFTLTDCKLHANYAQLTFAMQYEGSVPGYPFPFKVELIYRFWGSSELACITRLENTGATHMPFTDGWHHYFTFDRQPIDQLQLQLPENCTVLQTNERQIPTGAMLPNKQFTQLTNIGDTFLDTCFKLPDIELDPTIAAKLYCPQKELAINIWQQTSRGKYRYLQVFTPPGRQSIAIEPMTAAPNAFNNHLGLQTLAPGESFEAVYCIQLSHHIA